MKHPLTYKYDTLHADCVYHVYNRANGPEKIFLSKENYHIFMKQYSLYIAPIADTFCYCLMPNHFHLLIRIKPWDELTNFFTGLSKLRAAQKQKGAARIYYPDEVSMNGEPHYTDEIMEKLLTKQFANLFSSYTQAFNKQNMRMGSMFMKNYKRKRVNDDVYLRTLVHYIHLNPVGSALCRRPYGWPYSSYKAVVSKDNTIVNASEVISWFDDVHNFRRTHNREPQLVD